MHIAYCEDETAQAAAYIKAIRSWSEQNNRACYIELFENAEQFLFSLDENAAIPYDLVLLDIAMKGMDGFTLARQLRQRDSHVRIAFLTSDPSHAYEGYELNAWRYILKPLNYDKIKEMLEALAGSMETGSPFVLLEIGCENHKIYTQDILYAEICGHYSTLHCCHETLTVKLSFSKLIQLLNEAENKFIRAHRSIAVNIDKVLRISRENCVLNGDIILPVSRGKYKELNDAFIRGNFRITGV